MPTSQPDEQLLFDLELEEELPAVEEKVVRVESRLKSAVESLFRQDRIHCKKVCKGVALALQQFECYQMGPFSGGEEELVAERLRELKYSVQIVSYSLLRYDWDPLLRGKCHAPKNNKFLSVQRDTLKDEIVVEMHFRQQFVIQNSSLRYNSFLDLLPAVFVGTTRMLQQLLPLICNEMSKCFASMGHTVPPWRRFQTVKSRWTREQKQGSVPSIVPEVTNFRILSVDQSREESKRPLSMLQYELMMSERKNLPQHTKGQRKSRFSVLREHNGLILPYTTKKDIYAMMRRKYEANGQQMHECNKLNIAEAVFARFNNGWFGAV